MRHGGVGGAALVVLMAVATLATGCSGPDDLALETGPTTASTAAPAPSTTTNPAGEAAAVGPLPTPAPGQAEAIADPGQTGDGEPAGDDAAEPATPDAAGAAPAPVAVPPAGNPSGGGSVPAEGNALDTSNPSRVVGSGTAASCTSGAVVDAVAAGGIITFDCGPDPVVITMTSTAKVVNANGPDIVIDGGNKVTLSGGGKHRILYMNTCDQAQGWTTSHCNNQDHPRLTVQNIALADGNSSGQSADGGGGGAIFARGGRLRIVNTSFVGNRCDPSGPDVGGAAVRALDQHDGRPVHVTASTFEGGVCSNGGGVSSIGVSWVIVNSVFRNNQAIGNGANPARGGTPGGGSGAAIYTDGNDFTVELVGTRIEDNHANEGGGAVFFVSNNRTGTMTIRDSVLARNPSDGFETRGFPGIFFLGASDPATPGSSLS